VDFRYQYAEPKNSASADFCWITWCVRGASTNKQENLMDMREADKAPGGADHHLMKARKRKHSNLTRKIAAFP